MWQISGSPLSNDYLGPFSPDRILYEFDGPKIFTVLDREHDLCLACWSAADEQFNRFIVVPTSVTIIKALEGGELPVAQALDQPRCWLWDISHDEQILQCLKVAFQDIPADCRPTPGTMLRPELDHSSRARVTEALRKSKSEPAIVQLTGRIREVDRDRMSFELREIGESSQSQKFVFEEQLRDQVIDALDSDELVTVAGQTHPIRNLVAATMISRPTLPIPANPRPQ